MTSGLALQTFWRITLPGIRWGVAYGVVLTTARALGEYRRRRGRFRTDPGHDPDAHAFRQRAPYGVPSGRRLRGEPVVLAVLSPLTVLA